MKLIKKGSSLILNVVFSAHAPLEQASVEKIVKQTKKVLGRPIELHFEIEDRPIDIISA